MNNRPIYATWCLSNNIGDALTPYLIRKITGQTPIYVPADVQHPKVMVTGSILNWATKYTTVWGAGFANVDDVVKPGVKIVAVRGTMTRDRIQFQAGVEVDVIGDPALLMPRFYGLTTRHALPPDFRVGIVPHYVNQLEVAQWIGDRTDIKLINVFDKPEDFVDDLCRCDVIYSSSLHGLILADAYGIPCQWIEGTVPLGGDGSKFHDYLGSVKKTAVCLHLQELPTDLQKLHDMIFTNKPPDITALCDKLWEVCPFKPVEEKRNEV